MWWSMIHEVHTYETGCETHGEVINVRTRARDRVVDFQ